MRTVLAALLLVMQALLVGCHHGPRYVWDRTFEERRVVEFENTEAAKSYAAARKHDHEHDGTTNFLLASLLKKPYVIPSDAGRHNDAVQRCDTNRDGVISYAEAWYYWNLVCGK